MEPVYLEGYAPWERRHRPHYDFMVQNSKFLVQVFGASVTCFFALTVLCRFVLQKHISHSASYRWKHVRTYYKQSWQSWLLTLHVVKIITSLCLPVLSAYAMGECDPAPQYRQLTGGFFKNTFLTNNFCVDNANYWEALSVTVYLAHLWVELFFYHFLIGEHLSALVEVYLYHGICITGVTTALIVGRMCLTLSSAVLLAEVSTVYLSMRQIF